MVTLIKTRICYDTAQEGAFMIFCNSIKGKFAYNVYKKSARYF